MSLRRCVSVPCTHLCPLSHRLCLSCSTSCACAFPTVSFRQHIRPPMTLSALVCSGVLGSGGGSGGGASRWYSGGFDSWDQECGVCMCLCGFYLDSAASSHKKGALGIRNQGSPTFANQRATSWVLIHAEVNQCVTIFRKHSSFLLFVIHTFLTLRCSLKPL